MDIKKSEYKIQLLLKSFGFILLSAGSLVMLGWVLKLKVLVQIIPDSAPMQFNTALCFFLSGLSLLFCNIKKSRYLLLLSLIIGIIPGLTLIEYCYDVNIGIDQLFIQSFISTRTSDPGRMAPNTAVCFVLFSFFLYLIQIRFKRLVFFTLLLPCIFGVLGLISVIGYIFNIEQAYAWGALTQMAPHTAIGFVLLAIASYILFVLKRQLSKKSLTTLLDYAIFSTTLLFFLLLWQAVRVNYINTLKSEAANQVTVINAKLSIEVQRDVEAIIRLFARYHSKSYSNKSAFNQDAFYYFKHMRALELLSVRREGRIVTEINPFINNPSVVSLEANHLTCTVSAKSDSAKFFTKINEESGYLCIYNSESAASISLKKIVSQLFQQNEGNFIISVRYNGVLYFQSSLENTEHERFWGKTKSINLYGNNWSVTVAPSSMYIDETIGRMPYLILSLGAFISLLVLFLLRYRRKLVAQEKALLSAEVIKKTILNSSLEGVLGVNRSLKIYFMNKAAEKLLNISFDNEKNTTLSSLLKIEHLFATDNILVNIEKSLLTGETFKKYSEIILKCDGKKLPVSYSTSPIVEKNDITGVIVVISDNTERQYYLDKLHSLAHYDTLTKLPNRSSIISHLTTSIANAKKNRKMFSLCFIDINKFKFINDTYGHHVGDKALQYVATVISGAIKHDDFLGRLSGDEFCLILNDIYSKNDLDNFLIKLHQVFEKPFMFENNSLLISLSIGVVTYENESTPEELLIKADEQMYIAKNTN